MATFYLLPSRPLLGQRFGELLSSLFPGLNWGCGDWPDLAEALGANANRQDIFVIYREDLPDESPVSDSLTRDFGAEDGDAVVEVHAGASLHDLTVSRWAVGEQWK